MAPQECEMRAVLCAIIVVISNLYGFLCTDRNQCGGMKQLADAITHANVVLKSSLVFSHGKPWMFQGCAAQFRLSNCLQCAIIHLFEYNDLLHDPVKVFQTSQSSSTYTDLCQSFERAEQCMEEISCSEADLAVLTNNHRWPTVQNLLTEICREDMKQVIPTYARECFVLPAVMNCISNFWNIEPPADNNSVCGYLEEHERCKSCVNRSSSECSVTAEALLDRFVDNLLVHAIPSGFVISDCSSTGGDAETVEPEVHLSTVPSSTTNLATSNSVKNLALSRQWLLLLLLLLVTSMFS